MKKLFAALLFFAACPKQEPMTPPTNAVWSSVVDDLQGRIEVPEAKPGETIDVKLWFKNTGAQPRRIYLIQNSFFRSFQSTLTLPKQMPPISPPHGYVVTEKDFPEIKAGEEVSFAQPYTVEQNTPPGEHLLTWEYSNKIDEWKGGAQTLDGPTKSLFGGGKIPGIWLGELSVQATLIVK
jgi:hypothetical protein